MSKLRGAVQYSGTTQELRSVAWNGSIFVVVGTGKYVLTSPDGVTWTKHAPSFSPYAYRVIWAGDKFVAVGGGVWTSPDGITWTQRHWCNSPDFYSLFDVAWSGSRFVAAGGLIASKDVILYSLDGINWTQSTSGYGGDIYGVTWNGSQFVAVGWNTVRTSTDGITWTEKGTPSLYKVVWGGNKYVGVDFNYTKVSTDGITWTSKSTISGRDIIWTGSQYVAVGQHDPDEIYASIQTSPDGITWTRRISWAEDALMGVAWNGVLLVAVAGNGTIITSSN